MSPVRVPAALLRGGTSKGVFLHERDLPPAGPARDALLLRLLGSPDPLQIDGLGGTYSSTSKVIVVAPGDAQGGTADVTYWFAQIGVDRAVVDWSGNCGNLTTAVGPFAIDDHLVRVRGNPTVVHLRNANTGVLIAAEVPTRDGRVREDGDHVVAGVPGAGAPIVTRYLEPGGGVLGATLPTGAPCNHLDTPLGPLDVSIVDLTHPYAIVEAAAVGLDLDRADPAELNADADLLARLESVRAAAAVAAGVVDHLGDAADRSPAVPRLVLVAPGEGGDDLRVLGVSMGKVHRALMMTGALCVAGAVRLPGTVAAETAARAATADHDHDGDRGVRLRHPRGVVEVVVERAQGEIRSVGVVRTARRLMDGWAYVPSA